MPKRRIEATCHDAYLSDGSVVEADTLASAADLPSELAVDVDYG